MVERTNSRNDGSVLNEISGTHTKVVVLAEESLQRCDDLLHSIVLGTIFLVTADQHGSIGTTIRAGERPGTGIVESKTDGLTSGF